MKLKLNTVGDGWHCLAQIGEWPNSGIVQVVDAKSCEAQAAAWPKDHLCGVGIDHYEDLTEEEKAHLKDIGILMPSDNYGLIDALEARPDGLYAHVGWTAPGFLEVTTGTYRFLSPVWSPADCEADGENRLRPLKLLRASLTNEPGIKGNKPLINRLPDGEVPGGDTKKKENPMKNIALYLGLAEDATEEQILAALKARDAKAVELENKCKGAEADSFVNRIKDEREVAAEALPKLREGFLKNREVAEEMAAMLPKRDPSAARKPLTNRDTAQPPNGEKAKVFKNRYEEWQAMPPGEGKTKFQMEHADELLKLEGEQKGAR